MCDCFLRDWNSKAGVKGPLHFPSLASLSRALPGCLPPPTLHSLPAPPFPPVLPNVFHIQGSQILGAGAPLAHSGGSGPRTATGMTGAAPPHRASCARTWAGKSLVSEVWPMEQKVLGDYMSLGNTACYTHQLSVQKRLRGLAGKSLRSFVQLLPKLFDFWSKTDPKVSQGMRC